MQITAYSCCTHWPQVQLATTVMGFQSTWQEQAVATTPQMTPSPCIYMCMAVNEHGKCLVSLFLTCRPGHQVAHWEAVQLSCACWGPLAHEALAPHHPCRHPAALVSCHLTQNVRQARGPDPQSTINTTLLFVLASVAACVLMSVMTCLSRT